MKSGLESRLLIPDLVISVHQTSWSGKNTGMKRLEACGEPLQEVRGSRMPYGLDTDLTFCHKFLCTSPRCPWSSVLVLRVRTQGEEKCDHEAWLNKAVSMAFPQQ